MKKWWILFILVMAGFKTFGVQVQLLTKAAQDGDVQAQFELAEIYSRGTGVAQDWSTAADWYERAAEKNLPKAQYALALCYAEGKGVSQNYNQAVHWLNKAAGFYYAPAQYKIGRSLEEGGLGLRQDSEKAVKWMREAASREYAPAMGALGMYYLNGFSVKADVSKAVDWYQRGARLGDEQSIQAIAGNFTAWSDYFSDSEIVTQCMIPKAESGDMNAQLALGKYYRTQSGLDSQAVEWLTQAAEQGRAEAVELLVEHYYEGRGVDQDLGAAIDYCRIVAGSGHPVYQEKLAAMYAEPGTLQDLNASYEWYLKAAKQGRTTAQTKCIFIYGKGTGTPQNRVEAYAWAMVVGNNGKSVYQKNLEPILSMEEKMQGMKRFRALLMEIKKATSSH